MTLPNECDIRGEGRSKRTKREGSGGRRVGQTVQGERTPKAFFDHERGIINKVIRAHNVQSIDGATQPCDKIAVDADLAGKKERLGEEIVRYDVALRGEGMVFAEQEAPTVGFGETQKIVARQLKGRDEHPEIVQAMLQPHGDVLCVAAVKREADGGMLCT